MCANEILKSIHLEEKLSLNMLKMPRLGLCSTRTERSLYVTEANNLAQDSDRFLL